MRKQKFFAVAIIFATLALAMWSCEKNNPTPPAPQDIVVRPGDSRSMLQIARDALSCSDSAISWSVAEPNGGVVDAVGNYSAPPCGSYTAGTYHVVATGCGRSAQIAVTVAEEVTGMSVLCGVVGTATCCALPPFHVAPGTTIHFYAQVTYSCPGHVEYDPTPMPPSCP